MPDPRYQFRITTTNGGPEGSSESSVGIEASSLREATELATQKLKREGSNYEVYYHHKIAVGGYNYDVACVARRECVRLHGNLFMEAKRRGAEIVETEDYDRGWVLLADAVFVIENSARKRG